MATPTPTKTPLILLIAIAAGGCDPNTRSNPPEPQPDRAAYLDAMDRWSSCREKAEKDAQVTWDREQATLATEKTAAMAEEDERFRAWMGATWQDIRDAEAAARQWDIDHPRTEADTRDEMLRRLRAYFKARANDESEASAWRAAEAICTRCEGQDMSAFVVGGAELRKRQEAQALVNLKAWTSKTGRDYRMVFVDMYISDAGDCVSAHFDAMSGGGRINWSAVGTAECQAHLQASTGHPDCGGQPTPTI